MITLNASEDGRALIITADDETREDLRGMLDDEDKGCPAALQLMHDELERYSCNGSWSFINPEDIGAITDAPMIAEESNILESGEVQVFGRVAWFPDYAVRNEWQELADTGRVEFPFGMEIA